MPKDVETMEGAHRGGPPDLRSLCELSRRHVLQGGTAFVLASLGLGAGPVRASFARLGFRGVPPSTADAVIVPEGYEAQVIARWGEPVGRPGHMPPWRPDASHSAADQAVQLGMHHDGLHFFPLDGRSDRGLLVMNHEYTDEGLLHPDGMANWSAEKVRKSQAAHGISVVEVAMRDGRWQLVRPSRYARRLTAFSPFALRGPAAGHPMMRTAADPAGRTVLGTLNNCAAGLTPWGTYLSGEENFIGYFAAPKQLDAHQRRWGLGADWGYRWHEFDERFDAARHPHEPNRFGWIVEVDPFDPQSTPVKRTALGRAAHEGATVAVTRDGRAVVYSGEDARFEYLYKFVSRDAIRPGGAKANAELLDHGILYVARFDADGRGRWLPLMHGLGPLTPAHGFADQGQVLIQARQASDALQATPMDRPEWVAVNPATREVFCSLTNNTRRGTEGHPGVDAAHPRARNSMGHIIRWREDGDFDGETFSWDVFLLAGDPANARAEAQGNLRGDAFANPDGLWVDARGVLWIQTDMSASVMGRGEFARLGHNQMLACDPATGEVRRFLTGPRGAEITGATMTPDGTTMFVNIQHPGEPENDRTDPAEPTKHSRWPDGGRPRSATVVVRRKDGGVVGACQ